MQPNPGGKAYETNVVRYLKQHAPGSNPRRINQPRFKDRGDIRFSKVVLQAKTSPVGLVTVGRYVDDAVSQAAEHDGAADIIPAAIARRPGNTDLGDDLVVLRASDFVGLMVQLDALTIDTDD